MSESYSWSASRSGGAYRLPGPDRLGWWAAAAMFFSILLHVIVFFALDQMKIAFKFEEAREISTRPTDVRQVEVLPPPMAERSLPPEDIIQPPNDAAALLDEVELLDILPENQEIDISPAIVEASYALQLQTPAKEGLPEATAPDVSSNLEIEMDLPELGREPETIRPAEVGQVTVDPGAVPVDDSDFQKFTDDLIQKGANGKVDQGTLDGVTSLDSMLSLPSSVLLSAKTMLPSDLLFEFNSSELRESAKVNLMKLGLLMDRNPSLYCWIEGHTDLVGGDEFNLNLSTKRAESVRDYLIHSLRMDPEKIITRGFGRYQPIVTTGTPQEQSANRRVEVRMRKAPPTAEQLTVTPKKATVIEPVPAPKAILVKPKKFYPPTEETPPPKALPAETSPLPDDAPRATPVEPAIPKAIPRAEAVPE
jgi:OOP family OmpA-OmpF porin